MKGLSKITPLMLVVLLACNTSAQNPPEAVLKAFTAKFANAKEVEWEKEEDSEWEAEFEMDEEEYSANFSNSGEWLETEMEIETEDLPKEILEVLASEFPGYEIEEAETEKTPSGDFYELEIEKGEEEMEVKMDKSGKILEKETKDEDND